MLAAVLIEDPSRLRDLAPEWLDLVARSAEKEPSVHPNWMLPWWDAFGGSDGRAVRTLAFYEGTRLVGLAPLLARTHRYRPGIPFKRLELFASGEDEADETCSDYLGLVAAAGYEESVASTFVDALVRGSAGPWDEIVLSAMSGQSALPSLLERALSKQGVRVTLEETNASPYIRLPKTFDEYLGLLKGQKRSQLKKSLRALEAWAGGMPVLDRVRSLGDLEKGKAILERLHKERWAGDGVYRSTKYRAFHDGAMPRLLKDGILDLGWMTVRGEPVVAFYNLRLDGKVYYYQGGRKLDIPDDVRVGVTMHALLIKDAIESGMREYDFLAGVSQYKMALATTTRPLVRLRAARPSFVETARVTADRATEQAKQVRTYVKQRFSKKQESETKMEEKAPKQGKIARVLDEKVRPLYFGPETEDGGALFGIYHPPKGNPRGRAILICPPLGYEGICAYPALRIMAERLAATGFPVLRFDYEGTGDSAGLDGDPGRVKAWVASVGHAITELRALSGASEVCIFGVRMGATLALKAAAERGDVERLVLWNPCASGRAYARELRAFRLFAEQTGELAALKKAEDDKSDESGGFLFTEETLKDLKTLDAAKIDARAAESILVIGRDDVPDDDKLAKALEQKGAIATYMRMGGYAEMMVAPHKSLFPENVYTTMLEWLDETRMLKEGEGGARPKGTPTARQQGIVAKGVREEPIRFGDKNGYFGVLTTPVDPNKSRGKPLIIWSNTAGNYRIGPNRMYVEMGRKLAAAGIPSIRIDVSGIGDSLIWEDEQLNHPYDDRLFHDVRSAIAHLKKTGRAEKFGVAGLCSGAFVAYHSAVLDEAITSIVLINLQIFRWEEGMSLDVNPLANRDQTKYYQRRLFSKEAWLKMLRGGVNVRNIVNILQGRVVDKTRATIAKVQAKMAQDASRGSEIARAFDKLLKRNVDVLIIFSGGDPGVDNLNVKVGASMGALKKNERFTIETIEGVDHSFTPIWSQVELDKVVVGHLTRRFA